MEFICRLVCSDFKANATFCFHGIGAVTKMVLIVSISFLRILRWFTLSKRKLLELFLSGYGGFVHKSCTICILFGNSYFVFAFDKFLSLTWGLCILIAAITQVSVTHKARPLKSGYQRVDLSRTSQSWATLLCMSLLSYGSPSHCGGQWVILKVVFTRGLASFVSE